MEESKSVKWGMDIAKAYHEIMKADEPTFCNFNGVYLYGGCKTPPHECADKQTMRTILAGMAMQSIMRNVCYDSSLDEYNDYCELIANNAVRMADALLRELNKEKEEETSHE